MEASILMRIARGDRAAFAQCVDQYGSLIWSLARRMCKTPADAEDATQDIFLSLWKKAARFDASRGSEAVFIAMIARRALIDRHRERQRRPVEVVMDELEEGPWSAASDLGGETASDAQRAASALKTLRPEQQRIISLSVVEGLSQSEIAEVTGMPLGTVKSLMRRGLLSIRQMLGGEVSS